MNAITMSDRGGMENQPLKVEHIRVRPDRIETLIRVKNACFASTNERVIKRVLKDYPTLGMHACRNHKGRLFADVMYDTSMPHLLEHMVVDGQTRCAKDEMRVFTGTTQWTGENNLVAQVTFSYEDDLIAIGVLDRCVKALNNILIDIYECKE